MGRFSAHGARRTSAALLVILAASGIAGCKQRTADLDSADPISTASAGPASYQATTEMGKKWTKDPTNINKGIA